MNNNAVYHVITENSIKDGDLLAIISKTRCDGIFVITDKETYNLPFGIRTYLLVTSNLYSVEMLSAIFKTIANVVNPIFTGDTHIITYICLNTLEKAPEQMLILTQIIIYLMCQAQAINDIKFKSSLPAMSIITYLVANRDVIFYPVVQSKDIQLLNAYFEVCSDSESSPISTTKLKEILQDFDYGRKADTIKNRYINLKKQLRGYPGFTETFRGSYLKIFHFELP